MKVHSRLIFLVVLPIMVLTSFAVHSYISFHSVNYSEIQRIINKNNDRVTHLPSSKPILRIMSWNLKYDKFKDFETLEDSVAEMDTAVPDTKAVTPYSGHAETSWSMRRFGIVNEVLFSDPDVFAVQECLKNQMDDLDEMLMYKWKWFGRPRDDGKRDGEHTAIFAKRSVFDFLGSKTLWLTDTPYEISQFPGSNSRRIATLLRLKHKATGDRISIVNSHFDSVSQDAKILAANLVRYVGSHEYAAYGYVFFTGDLNGESTSVQYKMLTGQDSQSQALIPDAKFNEEFYSTTLKDFSFQDLLALTPPQHRMGHLGTATGFRKPPSGIQRIDYIMGGVLGDEHLDLNRKKFDVVRFRTGDNFFDYGVQLSDHRPIIADVLLY